MLALCRREVRLVTRLAPSPCKTQQNPQTKNWPCCPHQFKPLWNVWDWLSLTIFSYTHDLVLKQWSFPWCGLMFNCGSHFFFFLVAEALPRPWNLKHTHYFLLSPSYSLSIFPLRDDILRTDAFVNGFPPPLPVSSVLLDYMATPTWNCRSFDLRTLFKANKTTLALTRLADLGVLVSLPEIHQGIVP